jgi:hypothetical protein
MTKPAYFEYSIVIVNLLWVCAVGLIYAPLAPLVTIGATLAFWFSSVVYKYQLLYVYISRAESGGRMWNVYVNRLIACAVLMQLLMVLSKYPLGVWSELLLMIQLPVLFEKDGSTVSLRHLLCSSGLGSRSGCPRPPNKSSDTMSRLPKRLMPNV